MFMRRRHAEPMPTSPPNRDVIPVLLFHSINDSPDSRIARFTTSSSDFARQVEMIRASGRRSCTFGELVRELAAEEPVREPLICLTFDDGWSDNRAALELLAEKSLSASVFVTTDYLDRHNMLTSADLTAISALPGIEIGAHSLTHPRLDELDQAAAAKEIRGSRQILEQQLSMPVATFAYPYGSHDERVRQSVIEAGFVGACAVKNALSHRADDRFAVARWTVERNATFDKFAAVVAGSGAPLSWSGERVRTRGYRAVRRARRSIAR